MSAFRVWFVDCVVSTCVDAKYEGQQLIKDVNSRAGIAQLVEHPTEKPGAILILVWVPSVARDFSPRVDLLCRISYSVHTAPTCNRMHQHLCGCKKSQTLAAIPLFGQTKILHTLIGMGRALPLRLPCLSQVRWPKSIAKDKEILFLKKCFN